MMNQRNFVNLATGAGFTEDQAEFMHNYMAQVHHHHDIDEVDGLEDALDDMGSDENEGCVDDDDEVEEDEVA